MKGNQTMQFEIEHAEAVATTATKASIGAAGSAVLFGLSATEIGAYCAMISTLITVVGVSFKIYFDFQAHKLKMKGRND